MTASMVITVVTAGVGPLLPRYSPCYLFMAALAGGVLGPDTAIAAELRWAPRISLQELYTDNAEAGESSGDAITTLTPGFLVTAGNSRMDISMDYSLQNNYYATREKNQIFHLTNIN